LKVLIKLNSADKRRFTTMSTNQSASRPLADEDVVGAPLGFEDVGTQTGESVLSVGPAPGFEDVGPQAGESVSTVGLVGVTAQSVGQPTIEDTSVGPAQPVTSETAQSGGCVAASGAIPKKRLIKRIYLSTSQPEEVKKPRHAPIVFSGVKKPRHAPIVFSGVSNTLGMNFAEVFGVDLASTIVASSSPPASLTAFLEAPEAYPGFVEEDHASVIPVVRASSVVPGAPATRFDELSEGKTREVVTLLRAVTPEMTANPGAGCTILQTATGKTSIFPGGDIGNLYCTRVKG
jgi:hypothetical protein